MIAPNQNAPRLERAKQVLERTSLSKSALYRLILEGKFPKPVQLAGRAVAFDSRAVDAWIAKRLAGGSL